MALGAVVSSTAGNSAAGGDWKHRAQPQGPSLTCTVRGLGLGEHSKFRGQRLTQDMKCGTGWQEIHGAAGGAGCPLSPFVQL